MHSKEVRSKFIEFFQSKAHTFVRPSPVVPQNDPTLLFTNAGMNQFKDVFLGEGTRDYTRAVNSQTCIRVSGKHNDLEEVGLDTYHLTLFEMLGNWSFGDFYKKEIIAWSWELITQVYGFPADKLYATVYETDDESAELWRTLTQINPDHVLKFDKKDNFWEMAETGPCGPCSEIHFDRGPDSCDKKHIPGHTCAVNGGCSRYIELWNLVFIQYERKQDGSCTELPAKHVDTGAGLERIVSHLQNTHSIYDTDLFQPIIQKIESVSGISYQEETGMSHRVISDHIRTLTFAIADNVIPSNEGRGYVLRRILRRALRYAKKLNINEPVIYKLVEPVVAVMGDYYDHLASRQSYIEQVIQSEEEAFLRTLETGLLLFEELCQKLSQENHNTISGAEAFKLYDTFGFPIDLTEIMAKEKGFQIDIASFNTLLEKQRTQSREANKTVDTCTTDELPKGGEARIVKDQNEILQMARHHTATHLLQAALRQVLGDHVHQAGSLVDCDRLRFDFTHFSALTPDQIQKVEAIVDQKIQANTALSIYHKPLEEAKQLGAMALFGEKYDDEVRVVQISDFSLELCGGHHCDNTGQIETFKILSESAIAAGTRRIEAIAGITNIDQYNSHIKTQLIQKIMRKQTDLSTTQIEALRQKPVADIQAHYDTVLTTLKAAEKNRQKQSEKSAGQQTQDLLKRIIPIKDNLYLFYDVFQDQDMPFLRNLSDNLANANPHLIIMLAAVKNNKSQLLVKLSPKLNLPQLNAQQLISEITKITGGSGGGRSDMAQAGGADPTKLTQAFKTIELKIPDLIE